MVSDKVSYPCESKPHYELLDGLRGVAALLVIWYHVFEGFATSGVDQRFNHGYLAVDFFFVLSGFVIGYAYDDRWRKGMTAGNFMLRRVIRLQPMAVIALLLGVLSFVIQGCETWTHSPVGVDALLLCLFLGLFFIPAVPGAMYEVRGNGEMFPLNGPSWSLFFEYIGSILYAVWLHRISTRALRLFVAVSGVGLVASAFMNISGAYSIGNGWSTGADGLGIFGGLMRMSFSFGIGLLMSRGFKPLKIRGAFWLCAGALALIMCMPYVTLTGEASVWNGVYDCVCSLFLFPLIVYVGASGFTTDRLSSQVCEFVGNISYPVYIIHYPAMYLFYSWVWNNGYTFGDVWYVAVAIFVGAIVCAAIVLKVYDQPVRRFLSKKLLK